MCFGFPAHWFYIRKHKATGEKQMLVTSVISGAEFKALIEKLNAEAGEFEFYPGYIRDGVQVHP